MTYWEYKAHKHDEINDLLKDESYTMDQLVEMAFATNDLLNLGQIYRKAQKIMIDGGYTDDDINALVNIAMQLAWQYCETNQI